MWCVYRAERECLKIIYLIRYRTAREPSYKPCTSILVFLSPVPEQVEYLPRFLFLSIVPEQVESFLSTVPEQAEYLPRFLFFVFVNSPRTS